MSHPEAQPHWAPSEIAEDLFVVYGSVSLLPRVYITRNMAVVRHQGELTLINAVRLDEPGLAQLEALGEIKHVIRLGPLHGMDDAFYVERYGSSLWTFADGTTYTEPVATNPLEDGGRLPFPDAKLFAFSGLKQTEGVILLQRGPGILLTVDSVQSYATPPHMPHTAWLTRKLLPLFGFPNKTIVGPAWTKIMTNDKPALKQEFARLQRWEFDQLLSAHGTFLPRGAKAELAAACLERFG